MSLLVDSSPPQFIVNDTNSSTFYQPIHANSTDPQSRVIGELYQDIILDASGNNRVGTHQGFAFNFGNSSALYNSNDILFFGNAGELNLIDTYILSGSGDFEKFSGGYTLEWKTVSDNPYIAEISLFESNVTNEDQTVLDELAFRITSEGGAYTPIVGEEGQIGQVFQNPVFQSGEQIGFDQGYGFLFPDDPHISTRVMGNRQFFFDDGNQMTVLNTLVVEASGPYAKFIGTYLNQTIISENPNFLADITLTAAVDADDEEQIELYTPTEGTYDFKITSDGGYYAAINNPEGGQIGERFQNPVFSSTGERVGTNQGYGFNFPLVEYTRAIAQGNRIFYLDGGTLNVFNGIIAGATGKYRAFKGGRFSEKIVSYNPVFESEITLVLPASNSKSDSNDQAKEKSDKGGSEETDLSIEEDEMTKDEGVGEDKASSSRIFVLSPMIGLVLALLCFA
mmetsp:Transcript_34683/g.77815  ORF Transcript_34683/g.77815 Transcript_34683/m.77815 type:complete len:452 (-) Transcript_34683:686-2041(-)